MRVPIISRRTERKQEKEEAFKSSIAEDVVKALSPAIAQAAAQPSVQSGATYGPSSPFYQTGLNYGYNPLPRPYETFGGGFGPANPLNPTAIDPTRPDGRSG